jgi:hypothetical protein
MNSPRQPDTDPVSVVPASTAVEPVRQVRIWFGSHVVAEYEAGSQMAARYEDAMRRRFAGLRVASDELAAGNDAARDAIRPLPSERLWELTP